MDDDIINTQAQALLKASDIIKKSKDYMPGSLNLRFDSGTCAYDLTFKDKKTGAASHYVISKDGNVTFQNGPGSTNITLPYSPEPKPNNPNPAEEYLCSEKEVLENLKKFLLHKVATTPVGIYLERGKPWSKEFIDVRAASIKVRNKKEGILCECAFYGGGAELTILQRNVTDHVFTAVEFASKVMKTVERCDTLIEKKGE